MKIWKILSAVIVSLLLGGVLFWEAPQTIFAENVSYTELGIGYRTDILADVDQEYYCSFTAPKTGKYIFYSECENIYTSCRLYSDPERTKLLASAGSVWNYNFEIGYEMTAGQTVYLAVYWQDLEDVGWSTDTIFLWCKEDPLNSYIELEADDCKQVHVDEWESQVFIFTAPVTGDYTFYSESDVDTYAEVYTDKLLTDFIMEVDDGDEDLNFSFTMHLVKGRKIYLATRIASGEAGDYRVCCKASNLAESIIKFTEMPVETEVHRTLGAGEVAYYCITFPVTGSYIIRDSINDDTIMDGKSDKTLSDVWFIDISSNEYFAEEGETLYLKVSLPELRSGKISLYCERLRLEITNHPKNVSVNEGELATFTATAPGDYLTYQWQKSSDGKTWVNSSSNGAKTNTLTMTTKASYNGLQFRCVVTDLNGDTKISDAAKLTVIAKGPEITAQPAAKTVSAGQDAVFTITATGNGLTYQWQKSSDGKTWANSSSTGAKTNTLTMTTKASYNGLQFRCVVTDKTGKKLTSKAAKLTVTAAELAITVLPIDKSVIAGQDAVFTITATGNGLTYQWQKSSDGKTWVNSSSTGAKTNTLTMTTKASYNGLQFRCVVTDKTGKKLTSKAAKLTVIAAASTPAIVTQPAAKTVSAGQKATFEIAALGYGLTYQWKKSTDGGKTWVNSVSAGATTEKLSMTAKASFNGYQFKCVVKDQNGKTVSSTAVKLTVK